MHNNAQNNAQYCTIMHNNQLQYINLIPRAGVWCLLTAWNPVKKWYCNAVTCGCLQVYDKQTVWIWDKGTMGPSMELKGPKNNCNDRCTEIVKFNIDWYLKKKVRNFASKYVCSLKSFDMLFGQWHVFFQ